MIDRALLDTGGRELLALHRYDSDQALFVRNEGLPDLMPTGTFVDVPGTGVRLYSGGDTLRGGEYSLTIGVYGRTHSDAFDLHRAVLRAAIAARAVRRTDGGILRLARFSGISRAFQGSAQNGGEVTAKWVVSTPYWWGTRRTFSPSVGGLTAVQNNSDAPSPLRVTITAGGTEISHPYIITPAGRTEFAATLPPNATLVIDGNPGLWSVRVNGVDRAVDLAGPQPSLAPGANNIFVAANGASVELTWQEARL